MAGDDGMAMAAHDGTPRLIAAEGKQQQPDRQKDLGQPARDGPVFKLRAEHVHFLDIDPRTSP